MIHQDEHSAELLLPLLSEIHLDDQPSDDALTQQEQKMCYGRYSSLLDNENFEPVMAFDTLQSFEHQSEKCENDHDMTVSGLLPSAINGQL